MEMQTLVRRVQDARAKAGLFNPAPATLELVEVVSRQCHGLFGHPLPQAYCDLLVMTNGLMEGGLTIWPCGLHWKFRESIITANRELRHYLSAHFIYLGQRDETVFAWHPATGVFMDVEVDAQAVVGTYPTCKALLVAALERVAS